MADITAAEAARLNQAIEAGRKEFPDFDDAANLVVSLSNDASTLRAALADLPDAHRIVARLADDPDEAARILSLRGTKLATELGRFSSRPEPVAPKPAAPPAAAPPTIYDDNLSASEWAAAWDKRETLRRSPPAPQNQNLFDPNLSMADFSRLWDERQAARRKARTR